ncbi:MAG: SfiI family type II restriction endonuclease [Acidobacteriaceae bacterium]
MFIDPATLGKTAKGMNRLEEIEKATARLVSQALAEFADARSIFNSESDLQGDIGEDITREALERMGVSGARIRVVGKIDYKRARLVLHPEYGVRQALLVDSKAEKGATNVARLQTSQTSLEIRQIRAGHEIAVQGSLPTVLDRDGVQFLTTTVFVKYHYIETEHGNNLRLIQIITLPNGMLQSRYNPDSRHSIWNAGPNAPARGEAFRTRINFQKLKALAVWRVQGIRLDPAAPFHWVG